MEIEPPHKKAKLISSRDDDTSVSSSFDEQDFDGSDIQYSDCDEVTNVSNLVEGRYNTNGNTCQKKCSSDNDSFENFATQFMNCNSTAIAPTSHELTTECVTDSVPLYESSKSIDENDVPPVTPKIPMVKEKKEWKQCCTYNDPIAAASALKKEDTWSVWRKKDTAEGQKWFFRCNKMKLRGPQCELQVYHLFKNDTDEVVEFRTPGGHDHTSQMNDKEQKEALKKEIEKLIDLNVKPNEIMFHLSRIEGLVLPTKKQLVNIIASIRKRKYGQPSISMQELEIWLKLHSTVPDGEHESFVLCYEVNVECEEPFFRFMITTKRLLSMANYRDLTHADATYKCIWQGYPVFMIGTTDMQKKYHPYALSVCCNEKTPDFKFIFSGIKDGLLRIFGEQKNQTKLVCDASFAIINAFQEVYGNDVTIIMCWYHAKTAMEFNLSLVKISNRDAVLHDIELLHLASSPEIFRGAIRMFLQKWVEEEAEYCKYFTSEWVEKHPNWYLGAAEFTPCHNNALEAANRYLKDTNTIRIRHPLPHFLKVAAETTHKWSTGYDIGLKLFAMAPNIGIKIWTASYQWAKSNIATKIIRQDDDFLTVMVNSEVANAKKRNNGDGVVVQSLQETEPILPSDVTDLLKEENDDLRVLKKKSPLGCHKANKNFQDADEKGSTSSQAVDSNASRVTAVIGKAKKNIKNFGERASDSSQLVKSTASHQATALTGKSEKNIKISGKRASRSSQPIESTASHQATAVTGRAKLSGKRASHSQPINTKSKATTATRTVMKNMEGIAAEGSLTTQPADTESNVVQKKSTLTAHQGFEDYKKSFLQWTVTVSKKPNSLFDGRCNCPAFQKEYICKHIMGISIRMRYVVVPPEAKTVPCGQKRKRGRPTKTKPALLIQ